MTGYKHQRFPLGGEQLWIAAQGKAELCFADLTAAMECMKKYFTGYPTQWVEMAVVDGEEITLEGVKWRENGRALAGARIVSAMQFCSSPTRGGARQVWEDTGWRVWRER